MQKISVQQHLDVLRLTAKRAELFREFVEKCWRVKESSGASNSETAKAILAAGAALRAPELRFIVDDPRSATPDGGDESPAEIAAINVVWHAALPDSTIDTVLEVIEHYRRMCDVSVQTLTQVIADWCPERFAFYISTHPDLSVSPYSALDSTDPETGEADSTDLRPEFPNREYCLLPPDRIRWIGPAKNIPKRFCPLAEFVLGLPRQKHRESLDEVLKAIGMGENQEKTLKNYINDLDSLFSEIKLPIHISTKSEYLIVEHG